MHPPTHSHCPRDESPLEWIGNDESQALECRTCSGLWVGKSQLQERVDTPVMHRLFHECGSRATEMRCPVDGEPLWEIQVNGVLIDRCNHCGGIWFDANELRAVLGRDKLGNSSKPRKNSTPTRKNSTPYIDDSGGSGWFLTNSPVTDIIGDILDSLIPW